MQQILLSLLLVAVSYAGHCVAETASELRALGDTALAANDLKTALGHYSKLIDLEPTKAMNFYKRAGILLRQRQYAKVLPDLNSALSLDPKFVEGYLHRAKVYGLRGDCAQAKADYETVLKLKPGNAQATKQIPEMNECARTIATAVDMAKRGDCNSANHYADLGLKIASESPKLIVVKAQCALQAKDYHAAIAETRKVLSADASNLDALAIRGAAYYGLGENDAAVSHFREGLRLDPEHKLMKTTYKKLRSLQKAMASGDAAFESGAFDEAAESFEDALRIDPDHHLHQLSLYVKLCRAYVKSKRAEPCVNACTRALQYDGNNFDAFLLRGECHLAAEKPQDALNDFQRAHQLNQGSQAAQEGVHRAQVELKKASRKDYYKILGVPKSASAKQIKKAFRKLALELHPDKQQHADDAARKAAEVKFREFTEAYEVLGTAENKQKYDNGEDININEQNMNQHFQHFHFPQGFGGGGGGQQFHFRFN